ncbi:MAG: Trehalose synthase [Parcubacteria group bacterium GW2011_GWA2_47_9]|nr:MAG: Trehalose synthase [Parcubacteria group bacterium GW2011_GWA2_47_9]
MWWKGAVIYELYADKFAGNFAGLSDKLDYLKNLGINCVHILPHYPSPMIDDGYDVSDYKGIRPELGTLDDFKKMAGRAHAMGIKVIVDLVLNHASTMHHLFVDASKKESASRNMFLWSKTGKEFPEAVNAFSRVKPKNWIWHPASGEYYFSTFYPEQADFNWKNPAVFDFFIDIMDFWVDMGADGFRLDAASHIVKKEGTNCKSLPETHAILMKLRKHIDKSYSDVILLAEVHDGIMKTKEYFNQGAECHLTYNFYLTERIFLSLVRADRSIFDYALKECEEIPQNSAWANFLRCHDEISLSWLTDAERKEVIDIFDPQRKYQFEAYTAMRLASMFKGDKEKILEAFRMLFLSPGAHIIYYGDEIGMENEKISAGEDVRRVVRGKFDWAMADIEMASSSSLFSNIKNIIAEHAEGK